MPQGVCELEVVVKDAHRVLTSLTHGYRNGLLPTRAPSNGTGGAGVTLGPGGRLDVEEDTPASLPASSAAATAALSFSGDPTNESRVRISAVPSTFGGGGGR